VIAFDDIWTSLACVAHCHCVLATDSAIKTMAAILRIPSVVLVGDYPDPFRDQVFLTPYVNDGIMRLIKFTDIDTLNPSDMVTSALAQCSGSKAGTLSPRPIRARSAKPLLHQRTI
jgi:ADP-heptose:LPS heptosyltransferase